MAVKEFWSSIRERLQRLRRKDSAKKQQQQRPPSADSGKVIDDSVSPPKQLTLDERLPVWTLENTKLKDFRPIGLELDTEAGTQSGTANPYLTNPVEAPGVTQCQRSYHDFKPDASTMKPPTPLCDGDRKCITDITIEYYVPNDKTEMSRLDRQHTIWTTVLDGDLVKSPVKDAKAVLDLGTGSGIWAADFARRHPNAEVLGVDLSKPTPDQVPTNCQFEEVDFTDPWTYSQKFDLIHGRLIFLGQSDPKLSLKRAFDQLAPGGYLEHQELYGVPLDIDGTMSGKHMETFFFDTVVASRKLGNNMMAMPEYAGWMREIGFEDVTELHYGLPLNPWAKGKYKAVGEMQSMNLEIAIGGLYTKMLTMGLGWTEEQAAEGVKKAIEDFKNPEVHSYWPIFVVYGRKPLAAKL